MDSVRATAVITRPPKRTNRLRNGIVIAVGLLVLAAAVVVGVRLIGNESAPADAQTAAPLPCETVMITPAVELPEPGSVKVNVFNATDRAGLAAETAKKLGGRGFVVKRIENDPLGKPVAGIAEIRYGAKGEKAAELMAFYVPGAQLVADGRGNKRVDLALGEAFSGLRDDTEVAAALASPSPSPSGPGCTSAMPVATTSTPSAVTATPTAAAS